MSPKHERHAARMRLRNLERRAQEIARAEPLRQLWRQAEQDQTLLGIPKSAQLQPPMWIRFQLSQGNLFEEKECPT